MPRLPIFLLPFDRILHIPIEDSTITVDVLDYVWDKLKTALITQNINYLQLSLQSLPGPIDIEPEETLIERVQSCANDLREIPPIDKVSMHPTWLTSDAIQLILHIEPAITPEIPQEPPQKRRKIKQVNFLSGPFVTSPPSSLGYVHAMRDVQKKPDERIANDRPNVDADLPPISLMYHGFGQFLDCIHTDSTNLERVANKPKFEMAIDKFICEMSIFYESESARQSKTLDCLNDIFESYLGKQPYSLIIPSVITGQRSTDGHAIGPIGTIEVGVQIKNEFGTSSCDPSVEFAAYYTQSLYAKALKDLENNFLFPALGIVVVGAHIGFYALTFTTTTRLVSLTPLLPMAIENGNRNARQDLLKAFEAACILRNHINQDTQNYKDNPQECSLPGNFPYVNQVPAIPGPGIFNFQIDREAYQGEGGIRYLNRFIYMATVTDSEDKHKVIVKFTRRYFRDLHEFCAQEGHAPKLLGYGNAPDGWHVVVMEWIDNEESDLQRYSSKYLGTWSADLRRLVNRFHEKGWVHGDLRDANLIISKTNPERIMLVDFDWGGDLNSGPVRYLTSLLNPELASEMDPNDLWITKERDKLVLEFALRKLEGKEEVR